MRKYFFLWLIIFPVLAFGQAQSYTGFYKAQFFRIPGIDHVIAEFEIQADKTISGKIMIGNEIKNLQGQIDPKGKFEAKTSLENGSGFIIKGEMFDGKKEVKVSITRQLEETASGGKKNISESKSDGIISQMPAPLKLADVGITDNGKTLLWTQHNNQLFGKEWMDSNATVAIYRLDGDTSLKVEVKTKTPNSERYFSFQVWIKQDGKKVWDARDLGVPIMYAEKIKDIEKTDEDKLNVFTGIRGKVKNGQLEIIGENEKEIIFKVTNLQILNLREALVQIDGYIHAAKTQ